MEQVQELLEILKETPEMALWALSFYFLFILVKLASWIFALKVVMQQLISRFFNYKEKTLNNRRGVEIAEMFEDQKIDGVDHALLVELLNSVKGTSKYLHESDLRNSIVAIKTKGHK